MPVLTTQPQEVVASPLTLYTAAIGSAVPALNVLPPTGTWTQLGVTGQNDYDSTGLTVTHNQTYQLCSSLLGRQRRSRRGACRSRSPFR